DYLSWSTPKIDLITKTFRMDGRVGGMFDFRVKNTNKSYNYQLRATWFTPEMIRASARYVQLRDRLTDAETVLLVKEAEGAGETVVLVELHGREGSGVIP